MNTATQDWALGREGSHEAVSEVDRRGKPLCTVVCMDTGLVRNDPVPGDDELARFYAEDYRKAYKSAERPRRRQILRNFRRAADHVRTYHDQIERAGRVLDVGAGSGEFAYLMQALGKTVTGIEPNAGYAAYCREDLGLDVTTAHLAADLFAPGQFDLIRLNHVLEHLNDPVRYLAMIAGWLAPGGRLYVEVPDIHVYCRTKSRGNMFHYGHIYTFNPWTLRTAAGLAGLAEVAGTAARGRDTTGVFLEPGPVLEPQTATDPENAVRVLADIRAHYDGAFTAGKARKPLAKMAARAEETLSGLMLGSPRAIGTRIARSLDAPGGAAG